MSNPRVLGGGEDAFRAILQHTENAESRIEMHAFLWHDDETGNRLGRAVLRAAERGVTVAINKDRVAAVYEHSGGNKQSFFHKRIRAGERLQAWFLDVSYRKDKGQKRKRVKQRRNPLVVDMLAHPNISINHSQKRFDHSKLFIYDNRHMILGSMGIGDDHRTDWIDMMVQVDGEEHVQRLRKRMDGESEFDRSRHVDFLVHTRKAHARKTCPMLNERLALVDSAEDSLVIEMAYLGDPRFTDAMARAVERGVNVTLVTGEAANLLQQLNLATCALLLKRTGAPDNLTIVLHPKMVHAKLMVIDGRYSDIGSANFTKLSHGVYDEVNLFADDPVFAKQLADHALSHIREGEIVTGQIAYRKFAYQVERAAVAYQSRNGA